MRRILTWTLVLAAAAFLAYTLVPQLSELRTSLVRVSWLNVALASMAAVPMFALKGIYHLNLLDRLSGSRTSRRHGLPIYLQAQIVRYLPGKIWGVVYQAQRMTTTNRATDVVIANLWQMATTNLLAVGVVSSVLLAFRYSLAWLLLLIPVVIAIEWLHRNPTIESWAMHRIHRLSPRLMPAPPPARLPPMPIKGSAILCAEWVFYFLAFFVFLHDRSSWHETIMSAAWYGGASLIALLAFVVPAGIAVREAIFVGSPQIAGLDAATLAVTAALARATFFFAELVVAAVSTLFLHGRHRDHS
ncbi:lysylphosphatidylglycerol synthase domain-containing protein [Marilutibacter aestuarii]|nr:lysylphosphatidylglycerol synthase domain-containing protein [Lysobacter aestuarii]